MFTRSSTRTFLGVCLGFTLGALGCTSLTEGELSTFAGEWCTLRGLGPSGFPAPGVSYVGMVLVEDGTRVLGTGSTSRPDDETLYSSRYSGDVVGDVATVTVTDLEDDLELPGPRFTLELRIEGSRDLVGTMSGDPDFTGPITLVRLGPRCFTS